MSSTGEGVRPAYCSIDEWTALSGMSRSSTYYALGEGHLRAIKLGTRTLINVDKGLAWLGSQPAAKISAPQPRPPRMFATKAA